MSEVKRLQQELAITKSKLQSASEMISKMPSEGIKMVAFIEADAFSQSKENSVHVISDWATSLHILYYNMYVCGAVEYIMLWPSLNLKNTLTIMIISLSTTYFKCVHTCQQILSD